MTRTVINHILVAHQGIHYPHGLEGPPFCRRRFVIHSCPHATVQCPGTQAIGFLKPSSTLLPNPVDALLTNVGLTSLSLERLSTTKKYNRGVSNIIWQRIRWGSGSVYIFLKSLRPLLPSNTNKTNPTSFLSLFVDSPVEVLDRPRPRPRPRPLILRLESNRILTGFYLIWLDYAPIKTTAF